jgi:cytosine/adenosine deaminase-related metal-dependent hydrolase
LAESQTSVAHCPIANSQLGYGIAPVTEMVNAGVSVGLGTDGAGSYTYNMFEVMRLATYLQKQKHLSADAFTAEQALEAATINGAKALNMEDKIGSIEQGKEADLIILDFYQSHLLPINRVVPKIVYSASSSDVITSIIGGKVVMENRKIVTLDEKEVIEDSIEAANQLVNNADSETKRLLEAPWNSIRAFWQEG